MSDIGYAMGWIRDHPDYRDYTVETDAVAAKLEGEERSIKENLQPLGVLEAAPTLPATKDLRAWCSPIEDQKTLGSCTAQAGIGALEYYERRAFGRHIDASRLFVYKTTRKLLGLTGDTGAFLRTTMASLVLFGAPPERFWPYTDADPAFDAEPSAFCYAYGGSYRALQYYRLDPPGITPAALLSQIKTNLAAGLPSMFGFSVYNSIRQAATTGKIPYPSAGDSRVGGHAVLAVGYDDKMKIQNISPGAKPTVGALLVRNSWGTGWGEDGYGWLPYEYVLKGLAVDWWSLIESEWVDSQQFGL